MVIPFVIDVESGVANAPQKPKTRCHSERVGAFGHMPLHPAKVNFRGQMADLTQGLERHSRAGVFPGENWQGLLIPDSRAV
jgi:hypothetical protein